MSKFNKTLLLSIPKGKKGDFYKSKIKPVDEDNNNLYFLQTEAKTVTYLWHLWHIDDKEKGLA
jgi:hypothetical protein